VKAGGEAFVLAESAALRIQNATATWGTLKLIFSEPDHLIGFTGAGERTDSMYATGRAELQGHVLSRGDEYGSSGIWYRAQPELHECHAWLVRTGGAISTELFHGLIIDGWRQPPTDAAFAIVTPARNRSAGRAAPGLAAGRHAFRINRGDRCGKHRQCCRERSGHVRRRHHHRGR
jgi:hypothetical protein